MEDVRSLEHIDNLHDAVRSAYKSVELREVLLGKRSLKQTDARNVGAACAAAVLSLLGSTLLVYQWRKRRDWGA